MRKGKILITASVLLFGIFFFTLEARAQTVTGYTSIDYYDAVNVVDAYSETDEDYDVDSAYGAFVKLSVVDQSWNQIALQSASDDGTYGFAAVEIQFYGSPDTTYTAIGLHKAYANQWDYNYENWPLVSIDYYDYYNFSFFENQNIFEPLSFSFLGPGSMVTRPIRPILLGATTDAVAVQTPSRKPASLVVLSVQTLPTGTSGDHGCAPDQDYGIEVIVKYQVIGDDGQALATGKMQPQERLTNSVINGTPVDDPKPNWGPIGPTRISGTSRFTDANGQFLDAPWGSCARGSFTHTEKQEIAIVVGNKRYPVRTNNITESSSASGAGSTSNGSDIQKSRP